MSISVEDLEKHFKPNDWPLMDAHLAQTDLKYLCNTFLNMGDWDKCHDRLATFLKNSKKQFKLILMPRGHLKTSVVTVGWSIQQMLNDFDTSILLANAVWDYARSFLSEIKEYLVGKSRLQNLFGRFESYKWNQDDATILQRKKANKFPSLGRNIFIRSCVHP